VTEPVTDPEVRHSSIPSRRVLAAVRAARPVIQIVARGAIVGRDRSRTNLSAGRFTRSEVTSIVGAAFARFEQHVPGLPSEPTIGSRQNVALAALTLSLFETLVDRDIERSYAIELTADICWRFYRQWGLATRAGTRLITRDPLRRLRLGVNAFLRFPFGPPGYRFDDVVQDDGRSLDMRRCPVADYLGSHGAADLCAKSWCNLAYALAEMWGGTLQRTETLVTGADRCDFRFRVSSTAVDFPDNLPRQQPSTLIP
jgi:hypothetical protein